MDQALLCELNQRLDRIQLRVERITREFATTRAQLERIEYSIDQIGELIELSGVFHPLKQAAMSNPETDPAPPRPRLLIVPKAPRRPS